LVATETAALEYVELAVVVAVAYTWHILAAAVAGLVWL
jgi:hypothetical protein